MPYASDTAQTAVDEIYAEFGPAQRSTRRRGDHFLTFERYDIQTIA